MDSYLLKTLLFRIALPLVAILVIFAVARARKLSFRDDLGLRWASRGAWPLWLLAWAVWIFAEDFLAKSFGMGIPSPWTGRGPGLLASAASSASRH